MGHYKSKPVALLCNWIGTPAGSMILEEVILSEAKEIIDVGVAGGNP